MPEISRFYGISVRMYLNEHPPPHFHVRYAEYSASVQVEPLAAHEGDLPPRILGMVIEWASSHRNAIMRNWWLARAGKRLRRIAPLE